MGGILNKKLWLFDELFPYLLNPLMGHTWNSYFYHHVKHHHVEGNGPDDLSSTIRYQRDELVDFLCYVGRFFFFIWLELPLYFARKGKLAFAFRAAFWEIASYAMIYTFWKCVSWKATLFVLVLPLLQLRVGLMVGNWGQHALVDEVEPTSDFRSSITLIDVAVSCPTPPISTEQCLQCGISEQPILLQRWISHISPSPPSQALARPSRCISSAKSPILVGAGPRVSRY